MAYEWNDPTGELAARYTLEQERLRPDHRDAQMRRENKAWQDLMHRRAYGPPPQPPAQPSEKLKALADAILADRTFDATLTKSRERVARERARREAAIADAVRRAQEMRDPRTTAERLAGMDHHDPHAIRNVTGPPDPNHQSVRTIDGIAIGADVIV